MPNPLPYLTLFASLILLRGARLLFGWSERLAARVRARRPVSGGFHSASGQATAEYALVLLGAAAVALMLAAWAAKTGKLGELFDAVVDQLIGNAR